MRNIFLFLVIFLFRSSIGNAMQPVKNSGAKDKMVAANDTALHRRLFLGANLTQLIAGDAELHAMYRFRKRYSVMVATGFDFNFLDFGRHIKPEDQCLGCLTSGDQESHAEGRYFWGHGVAFRIVLTDNYSDNNHSHFFISLYSLVKYHNYNNYYFGEGKTEYCESAIQQIFGFGLYTGYEIIKNHSLIIRPYGGLGLRSLHGKIHRPEIYDNHVVVIKEKNFTEDYGYPALDIGLVILFGKE